MLTAMLLAGIQFATVEQSNCLNRATSDQDSLRCAEAEFGAADADLQQVYAFTLRKFPLQKNDIVKTRLSFLRRREQECVVKSAGPETDALYKAVRLECMTKLTRLEIKAIQEPPLP